MPTRFLPLTILLVFACKPAHVEDEKPTPTVRVSPSVINITSKKPSPSAEPAFEPKSASGKTRRALLIGCSGYPNLPPGMQLRGPANDVHLVRDLLVKRFGFSAKNITILSDAEGEKDKARRPIRANIKREYERLAKEAKKGDMVYIHMSGHGSQQPQKNPDDPESYEPDGLSEIFLPADVDLWDDKEKGVTNAIVDTEFRDWLKAIRAKEAAVVIVVDTCHSGTIIRGEEQAREVEMAKLKIPHAAIVEAQKKAEEIRDKKGPVARSVERVSSNVPDLVAFYASRPHEPTFESRLPRGASDAKPYGLFTFSLVQALTKSRGPLSYLDVARQVHHTYQAMGRNGPIPSVEGKYRDLEFLGHNQEFRDPSAPEFLESKKVRSLKSFRLSKDGGGWKIDAGGVHGLTAGTIFSVYESSVDGPKAGHVVVSDLGTLTSGVTPCAFAGMPEVKKLPDGGICRKVFVNLGIDRLRVAIDPSIKSGELRDMFQKLDKSVQLHMRLVDIKENPDWLVREGDAGLLCVPSSGWTGKRGEKVDHFFGPIPFDNKLGAWIENTLPRISRATNLLRLAAAMEQDQALESDQAYAPKIKVDILLLPDGKLAGAKKVQWGAKGITLHEKDIVVFEFTNDGKQAVDVSLLFVDSHYGILPLFPQPGTETDNRLKPDEVRRTPRIRINAKTQGVEHIVVFAVRSQADKLPIDFSCLAQPTIEKARGMIPDSPLGKLLQTSMYGLGDTRGAGPIEDRNYATRVLSWTTVPGVRKSE